MSKMNSPDFSVVAACSDVTVRFAASELARYLRRATHKRFAVRSGARSPQDADFTVGLATDLHLVAALPVGKWIEYHQPSGVIDDLITQPFAIDGDGMLPVPTEPGLGVELDWDGIERLSHGAEARVIR